MLKQLNIKLGLVNRVSNLNYRKSKPCLMNSAKSDEYPKKMTSKYYSFQMNLSFLSRSSKKFQAKRSTQLTRNFRISKIMFSKLLSLMKKISTIKLVTLKNWGKLGRNLLTNLNKSYRIFKSKDSFRSKAKVK